MNPKLEHFVFGLILAPPAPLAGLLVGWWGSYALLPERWIPFGALSGLFLGILADIFMLKKLLDSAHQLGRILWVAVFLFYTIGVFGFFMGVPLFNAFLAIPAGFIVGAKLARQKADPQRIRQADCPVHHRHVNPGLLCICVAGPAEQVHGLRSAGFARAGIRGYAGDDHRDDRDRRGGFVGG